MPSYDFKIAKESLTESEKDRILAIYLNTVNDNVCRFAFLALCDLFIC